MSLRLEHMLNHASPAVAFPSKDQAGNGHDGQPGWADFVTMQEAKNLQQCKSHAVPAS